MMVALAALLLAVPAALFVAWPLRHRRADSLPATGDEDARGVLESEKVLALRALRELDSEREAGLLADDDYAALRTRYEARAATVLRQLDALGPAPPAPPPREPARPAARRAPAATPVAWTQRPLVLGAFAVVLLGFGIVLGALAVRYARPDAAPEAAIAQQAPEPPFAPPPGAGDPARPLPKEMLEGMLRAAHASLDAGRYQEAIAAYKAVLKREPQNVEAITHLGLILAVAGHTDGALEALDRALAIDPGYAHAWWDKARLLYEQRQDYAGAIAAWERFVQVGPPGPDREHALSQIREARTRLAAKPAGGATPPAAPSR
jgi:tetratricopeptide (TPR) repeat protein